MTTRQPQRPLDGASVAIIGAGIAGLTAAIALTRHGATVTVIEQAAEISPVGAGLQLSPNATRILAALDVLGPIEALWHEPPHIRLVSGRDMRVLARIPAGSFARRRWGAPYGVLHRSVLQKALLDAAAASERCRIVLGRALRPASCDDLRRTVHEIVGEAPDLIVGADGVWSGVRRAVPGHGSSRFSGYVAWRMRLDQGGRLVEGQATTAFLGPSSHLVAYPLASTGTVNLVAITRGRNPGETWAEARAPQGTDLRAAFRGWHPDIRAAIDRAGEATFWPLFEVAGGSWTDGRNIILIGDAAHAMMPFAAQGAAMAIEDAFELATALASAGPKAMGGALPAFAARRQKRVEKVRARTAFNRFAYHARGPIRIGRDVVLGLRGAESLAADLDWLYGYRAEGLQEQYSGA